jgi:hypothetical protein
MSNTVNWISVKDRLPDRDRVVLVYAGGVFESVFYSTWSSVGWSARWIPLMYSHCVLDLIASVTYWAIEPHWQLSARNEVLK